MTTTMTRRVTPPRAVWQALAAVLLGAVLIAVLASTAPQSDTSVTDAVPAGFPVPSGAQLLSQSDSVTLDVPGPVADVEAFFRESLPPAGWTVTDTWDGTDPNGLETTGLVVEHESNPGAIGFTENGEGRVLVRLNLTQPKYSPVMEGMGGP